MRLFNRLTRQVEDFHPLEPGHVRIYTCGPTVYSRPHIGNYRAFVFADLLRRSLEFEGYRVTHVMNITDVGHLTVDDIADAAGVDKLERAASELKVHPLDLARKYEAMFHEDLATLHCLPATHYPRATDYVPGMIALIERLIDNGHAYVVDGNVYYDVSSFPAYGALSGNTVADLQAGASERVDERHEKRRPEDFALWKHDPEHLLQWDSPWGSGFPGWHIECSTMSMSLLGESFDIHTGGPDNMFPHHECEIAQSEGATGKRFVQFWMYCGYLNFGDRKMSKSSGAVVNVPELVESGFSGADIRYTMLTAHYRTPMAFDETVLVSERGARARLDRFVNVELPSRPEGPSNPEAVAAVEQFRSDFRAAIADDLNTPQAIAALHVLVRSINRLGVNAVDANAALAAVREADTVLAVLEHSEEDELAEQAQALLDRREIARRDRDFATADAIRDELRALGIEIEDTDSGPRWRRITD
ncbi:MAG TPA: cysteine--tRNA ligase [Acidimicrobiia bacterium]|nr:cysteine--tRNA ligase [Acidimicrobiia bacterium]